ncbi:hypothetical protein MSG28_005444 [Choristoneura fumiferana]|uniref:Uncharacterized protein n=1 Tax=Choristoneura fumiferana TaxID=7141 RepID=A0ACC0KYU2_CHOFU|nr:hypothetical protein MSG28_005444 [Choristoneura fumiferana]
MSAGRFSHHAAFSESLSLAPGVPRPGVPVSEPDHVHGSPVHHQERGAVPEELVISVGRPEAWWTDDLKRIAGGGWMRGAEDRVLWRAMEEAYVQQWTAVG